MSHFDKAKALYELNKDRKVTTEKYEGVVCGFHFQWDDNDSSYMIIAILVEKSIRPGIRYMLHGDVYVTHQHNALGYAFIHTSDLEQYGLIKK